MEPKDALILVVDDEAHTVLLLRDVLTMEGFNVAEAHDGLECLEVAKAKRPHAILLDINMPNLDGRETCRRLKAMAETRHIPVIFISAYTLPQDRERGLALGAVEYLPKPIDLTKLLEVVRISLNQNGSQQ